MSDEHDGEDEVGQEIVDGRKLTSVDKAIKDMLVVQMKGEGIPIEEIARRDGRSDRQIRRVLEIYATNGLGGRGLLDKDPVKLVEEMVDRTMAVWKIAAQMAATAKGENSRIGALNTMLRAEERLLSVLQSTGKLPKELGTMRHVIDLRALGAKMLDALDAWERGDADAESVRKVLYNAMGYDGPPQLEPPDAEVV